MESTDTSNAAEPDPKSHAATDRKKPAASAKAVKANRKRPVKSERKRSRRERPYPNAGFFTDILPVGEAIVRNAGGTKIRRLTLLEKIKRSPGSSITRDLLTNASKYGLLTGSYKSEWLELTKTGVTASDEAGPLSERRHAQFQLAFESVEPFKQLYLQFVNKRRAAPEVMRDYLDTLNLGIEDSAECLDIFIVNAEHLGLLRTIAGAEMLIPIEQVLEETASATTRPTDARAVTTPNKSKEGVTDWANCCFYIAPIGDEGTDARRHSDLFLRSLIEPAMEQIGLTVVRADQIGQAGMITTQVIEHLCRAKLVIADLSSLNANVFYEMALRHARRLPIVQIIRRADRLPFDINQVRTVVVDTTDIYSLVPKIDTYRSEIAAQARSALEDPAHIGNPLTIFFPEFFAEPGA